MSFSKEVKEELNAIQIKGNCCKKAFLLGALLSAGYVDDEISIKISDSLSAEKVISLLGIIYKCMPEVKVTKRGCFESTEISFKSKKIAEYILNADTLNAEFALDGIFKCKGCHTAFLRGAFCSFGTVSDPQKSYSLEMRVPNAARAELLNYVISETGISSPSLTKRDGGVGLFYRNEASVEDFFSYCEANQAVFAFYQISMEKDLRNQENRATNFVASNISKAVAATELQISAIEALKSVNAYNDLPRELKLTADLRVQNPDMSLGELAELHVPRISKSGLNHRLTKIIDEAKRLNLLV